MSVLPELSSDVGLTGIECNRIDMDNNIPYSLLIPPSILGLNIR